SLDDRKALNKPAPGALGTLTKTRGKLMKRRAVCLIVMTSALILGADDTSPTWTNDVSKMQFPDGAAKGTLLGKEFHIDTVKLENGTLTLQLGTDVIPDAAIIIFLPIKSGQTIEGKTFEFGENAQGAKPQSVHIKRK